MSEFRFEKIRVAAALTLTRGAAVPGRFFVAGSAPDHDGPERVGDLLNAHPGFFPFEGADGTTALYNRAQLVFAALDAGIREAEADPGYLVAKKLRVRMLLSTGEEIAGTVPVYRPDGRDRLSDYAQTLELFRYVVTSERELLVNSTHIVELRESAD